MANLRDQLQEWKTNQIGAARYSICKSCEHFITKTFQCSICKCFMPIKTRLLDMKCPENKWKE